MKMQMRTVLNTFYEPKSLSPRPPSKKSSTGAACPELCNFPILSIMELCFLKYNELGINPPRYSDMGVLTEIYCCL